MVKNGERIRSPTDREGAEYCMKYVSLKSPLLSNTKVTCHVFRQGIRRSLQDRTARSCEPGGSDQRTATEASRRIKGSEPSTEYFIFCLLFLRMAESRNRRQRTLEEICPLRHLLLNYFSAKYVAAESKAAREPPNKAP